MAVKRTPGIIPLGNECYAFLEGNVLAVYPWDERESVDAALPGHGASTGKSIILLRGGTKLRVGLKPGTLVSRYLKAAQASLR